jgi:single stranded DNA-binding protein
MKFKNYVELVGNLVADIEVKRLSSGTPFANFRVVTNKSFKNKETGDWDEKPTFHQCVMYGEGVANIEGLRKGQFVMAVGEISQRAYERRMPDGTVIPNWPIVEIKVSQLRKVAFGAEDETPQPFTQETPKAPAVSHDRMNPQRQRAAYQSKSKQGPPPEPDWGGEKLGVSLDDLPGEFDSPKQRKTLKDIPV